MSALNQQSELSAEDKRLEYTQAKRKLLIESLTKNDSPPEERGDKMVLLAALDGMDRSTLTRLRIKTEDKAANNAAAAAAMIAELLTTVSSNRLEVPNVSRAIPVLEQTNDTFEFVDGENVSGTQYENYTDFMAKFPKQENQD
jgi:hypothetical protein